MECSEQRRFIAKFDDMRLRRTYVSHQRIGHKPCRGQPKPSQLAYKHWTMIVRQEMRRRGLDA